MIAPRSLAPSFLESLSSNLLAHGIEHGELKEGQAAGMNHSVTDGGQVFLKVSKVGEVSQRPFNELSACQWLETQAFLAPRPLISRPLKVQDEAGEARLFTVWSYVETVKAPSFEEQLLACVELSKAIIGMPVQASNESYDLPRVAEKTVERVRSLPRCEVLSRMLKPAESTMGFLSQHSNPLYWLHGDLHVRNVMWTNDGPMLGDWEYHGPGPVEWDMVQVFRSIYMFSEMSRCRSTLTESFSRSVNAYFPTFDWDIFLAGLQLRNSSSSWNLYLTGCDPDRLQGNLDLQDDLDSGTLSSILQS